MLKIEFKNSLEDISKILESKNSQEKIRILETLHDINNLKILQQIISRLNDNSIQVRGEAFNSLLLNQNDISKILIDNLNSSNKNIKSFTALVLANRNEKKAIPDIIKLVDNEHGMVRILCNWISRISKSRSNYRYYFECIFRFQFRCTKKCITSSNSNKYFCFRRKN